MQRKHVILGFNDRCTPQDGTKYVKKAISYAQLEAGEVVEKDEFCEVLLLKMFLDLEVYTEREQVG